MQNPRAIAHGIVLIKFSLGRKFSFNQMIQDSEKAAFDVVLIKEKDLFSTEGICADVYIFDRRD